MNFVEKHSKFLAVALCLCASGPILSTVHAYEVQPGWHNDGKTSYYVLDNHKKAKGLTEIEDEKYYFDQAGNTVSGWQNVDNQIYYFDNNGKAVTGKTEIQGTAYNFGTSGTLSQGWENDNYYNEKGFKVTSDLVSDDDGKYYVDETGCKVTDSWEQVNNDWYYFDNNGQSVSGQVDTDTGTYYTNADGIFRTGWFTGAHGTQYYLEDGSVNMDPYLEIDGSLYAFDENGYLLTNTMKDEYYINDKGVALPADQAPVDTPAVDVEQTVPETEYAGEDTETPAEDVVTDSTVDVNEVPEAETAPETEMAPEVEAAPEAAPELDAEAGTPVSMPVVSGEAAETVDTPVIDETEYVSDGVLNPADDAYTEETVEPELEQGAPEVTPEVEVEGEVTWDQELPETQAPVEPEVNIPTYDEPVVDDYFYYDEPIYPDSGELYPDDLTVPGVDYGYADEEPEDIFVTDDTVVEELPGDDFAAPEVETPAVDTSKAAAIAAAALAQVGATQDCTMLVTNALAAVGINFHGWPADYASLGTWTSNPVPGDIIIYSGHVAVYIGNGQAVHGGFNGANTVVWSVNCSNALIGYIHVA